MSVLCSMVGASFTVAAAAEVLRSKKGITAVGNAQIDTAQSKFGGSSALFDGTGDYLDATPFSQSAGDTFTFECWVRFAATPSSGGLAMLLSSAGSANRYLALNNVSGTLNWEIGHEGSAGTFYRRWIASVSTNIWYHVALTKNGTTGRLFVNGTLLTVAQDFGTLDASEGIFSTTMRLGAWSTTANALNGHMDEIRISDIERYTTGFTAPTAPFVNDANTLLLIHANGTDASTFFEDDNGLTRAPINAWQPESGVVISSTQSKFGGTSLYTPGGATLYHSQYSGASNGNALINFGTGDFTLEFWIYPTSTATTSGVITKRNNTSTANGTWGIYYNGSTRTVNWQNIFPSVTTTSTASSAFSLNAWSHWAFVRSSGTFKIYVDGVEKASASNSLDYTFNSEPIRIGDWDTGGGNGHIGYLDEVRVSNTARYTSAFTAPTTPFVNDANTLLLMHMDGTPSVAVFRDDNGSRRQNGIQAFGNAQVDTAQSKFGGAAALFDGNGDYLQILGNNNLILWNTQPYTIELWCRINALSSQPNDDPTIIGNMVPASDADYWSFGPDNSGNLTFKYYNGGSVTVKDTGTMSTGVWYHIAAVISSNTIKIYLDGVEKASASISGTPQFLSSVGLNIGWGASWSYNGWVDEVRISNSARYTAAFTPSTIPFQSDANTLFLMHADGTDASTVFTDDNGIAPYTV